MPNLLTMTNEIASEPGFPQNIQPPTHLSFMLPPAVYRHSVAPELLMPTLNWGKRNIIPPMMAMDRDLLRIQDPDPDMAAILLYHYWNDKG